MTVSTQSFARLLAWVLAFQSLTAGEVQHHGVVFEQWVRDTFFDAYQPSSYTQKWDVPAEANTKYGGVPVNPKAAKYRTPVDLGDALRQFDIHEAFLFIIGYWVQEEQGKRMVNILPALVEPATWRKLWGPVTRADIERLDALIKDRSLDHEEARRLAQEMKSRPPFSESVIVFNPKIDSETQRRLQCSLRFEDLFNSLAPGADSASQPRPVLWGIPYPGLIESGPREFVP